MNILAFSVEVVCPNNLASFNSFYDNDTQDILRVLQKVVFVSLGEFLWGEEGTTEEYYHDMNGAGAGWHPHDGFNDEHKRSVLVDAQVSKEWRCGEYGLEMSWRPLDAKSKNLKFEIALGACDDAIRYDLYQASDKASDMAKRNMVALVRMLRRKIRATIIERLFYDCEDDADLNSISVNVQFPGGFYCDFAEVPQWVQVQPMRVAHEKCKTPSKGKKK